MKQQTYIAYIYNKQKYDTHKAKNDGSYLHYETFERFADKRKETVKRKMLELLNNDLYRACMHGELVVEIVETPDGYNDGAIVDAFSVGAHI